MSLERNFWDLVCWVCQGRSLDLNPQAWGLLSLILGSTSDIICSMLPDNSGSSMEGSLKTKTAVRKLFLQSIEDRMGSVYHDGGSVHKKEGMHIRPQVYQDFPNLPFILG